MRMYKDIGITGLVISVGIIATDIWPVEIYGERGKSTGRVKGSLGEDFMGDSHKLIVAHHKRKRF